MKKILLAIAIAMSVSSAHADTVIKDTITGIQFMPIKEVVLLNKVAKKFTLKVIFDNLDKLNGVATFYYELLDGNNIAVFGENVTINGEDYEGWNANEINSAYLIVAAKKGFIFDENYVE